MFHEMTLKLYYMKFSERNFIVYPSLKNTFSNTTPPVVASERWKIIKAITFQRIFFTQVTGNRLSDHYARNVFRKIFL